MPLDGSTFLTPIILFQEHVNIKMAVFPSRVLLRFVCCKGWFFLSQIGPGIVYLTFETPFGRGAFLQALTPVGPLMQRMIHHIYMERWIPTIIAKFYLLGEALMVSREGLHAFKQMPYAE